MVSHTATHCMAIVTDGDYRYSGLYADNYRVRVLMYNVM